MNKEIGIPEENTTEGTCLSRSFCGLCGMTEKELEELACFFAEQPAAKQKGSC